MIIAGIPLEAWIYGILTFIGIFIVGYIITSIIDMIIKDKMTLKQIIQEIGKNITNLEIEENENKKQRK